MSKRNAIIQPLGLATILALGFGFLIFLLGMWIINIYEESKRHQEMVFENILILDDGKPVIIRQSNAKGDWKTDFRDLSGKEITEHISQMQKRSLSDASLAGPDDFRNVRL